MGDNITYQVNDDGSVTVEQQLSEQEKNILDIMKIEKSKGGVFASRRMKKRAIKYAKSVNLPTPKMLVEKLMLDHYPKDFGQYGKTTMLIIWTAFIGIFLLGTATLSFLTYFEYHDYTVNARESLTCNSCEYYARWAEQDYDDFITYLSSAICCLGIAGFGIWQYQRTSKNILNNLNEK